MGGPETSRQIHAVEMVRKIKGKISAKLAGKSDDEIIEFFRKAGARARQRVKQRQARSAKRRPTRKRK